MLIRIRAAQRVRPARVSDDSYTPHLCTDTVIQPALMALRCADAHTDPMNDAATTQDIMRVYVVEDSLPICERIVQMINEVHDMRVVGTADNAPGAIQGITACLPHAVILDLRLAQSSGLTVLRAVTQTAPRPKIMVLTNFSSDQYRNLAREHGADAFLDKSNDFMRITEILHTWRHPTAISAMRAQ